MVVTCMLVVVVKVAFEKIVIAAVEIMVAFLCANANGVFEIYE